jgi:hypothetical protein
VGDIEGEGKDALVGGVGKKVLVVDHRGSPVWNIRLESNIVACDARDVDGDDAAEVVIALQNNRVILYNDDKDAIFTKTMRDPVADVWLEDITKDSELEVVVADRKGKIIVLTAAGYQLKELQLGARLSVFAVLCFGDRTMFITGDQSSTLRIWDIDGNEVSRLDVGDTPRAMATGVPDDISEVAFLVVSTKDRKLSFWEVQDSGKVTRTEKVILQQIGSTKTVLYRRAIKCGNCGAPTSPEASTCSSCGAQLEMVEEYVIEEYIQESIDSITAKHNKIKLKELDRILRRTLPRPAAYNLRRSLQAMLQSDAIEGHIDGNVFVRTEIKKEKIPAPSKQEVRRVEGTLRDLLLGTDTLDIHRLEKDTGVDRKILRRTLIILLGEGTVQGSLSGNEFILEEKQDVDDFTKKMVKELATWSG